MICGRIGRALEGKAMSLRETLNNNSALVAVAAIALLVLTLGYLIMSMTGGTRNNYTQPSGKWFYDVDDDKIFLGDVNDVGPIAAPSGGEGVEIVILTCEDSCGGHNLTGKSPSELESLGLFVSHIRKLSKRGKARYDKLSDDEKMYFEMEMYGDSFIVRELSDEKWYAEDSPKMQKINEKQMNACDKKKFARYCMPGQ